jgi:hypothetical protein
VCKLGKTWAKAAGTLYADTVCADVSECDDEADPPEFENVKPTLTSDRTCISKQGLSKAWPLTAQKHCKGLDKNDDSGWYWVAGTDDKAKEVWCDNKFLGGGWLMIARGQRSSGVGCWQDNNDACNEGNLKNDQKPQDGSKPIGTFPAGA